MFDRDSLTALVPPGFDDQPTASRLHARPKAMGFGPVPVVRLVSSLWHSLVLLKNLKS
jgi:hypothetical protein